MVDTDSPSSGVRPAHRQLSRAVRHDWGLQGALAISAEVDVAVVVDVLSFTTTLSVAADAGITVLPYRWAADDAEAHARRHQATLAVRRSAGGPGRISLSPATVRAADPPPARLVLPSPNGSTIAHHLARSAPVVVGASLRNATATADWITAQHLPGTARIAVISAGERWPDGSLRPCAEDLWGAGALLDALAGRGWRDLSPEARLARTAYQGVRDALARALQECASGQELITSGYPDDVDVAAEVSGSGVVPILVENAFVPAASR